MLLSPINAGDGGHFHPTQTLTDLLTISREKGRLNDLTVGFCGDLKYGRTVHSLIAALSRYTGIRIVLISPRELAIPDYVKEDVLDREQMVYTETVDLESALPELDILYMTRIQRERFADMDEYERLKDSYVLNPEKMEKAKPDMAILHPLPRVNEISVAVDKDPRACYFKQARNGKFIRMALILKLLAEASLNTEMPAAGVEMPGYRCPNPGCILSCEQELTPLFRQADGVCRCAYCDAVAEK